MAKMYAVRVSTPLEQDRVQIAALFGWIYYHLGRHPVVYEMIHLGKGTNLLELLMRGLKRRFVTFEHLKGSEYLHYLHLYEWHCYAKRLRIPLNHSSWLRSDVYGVAKISYAPSRHSHLLASLVPLSIFKILNVS